MKLILVASYAFEQVIYIKNIPNYQYRNLTYKGVQHGPGYSLSLFMFPLCQENREDNDHSYSHQIRHY